MNQSSLSSLLPFLLFLLLFMGTGLVLTWQNVDYAFYQLPASIAIIPAIIFAFMVGKQPFTATLTSFIQGAGNPNIITMCLIYLLAGAFATIAKSTGSVDATVAAGLALFPESFLLPGLFLVSAFVATAMGTSMGTIAAVAPIALGLTENTNLSAELVAGCVLSGAIFGDNLSIISDTTIASTRSQGAAAKDKFKINLTYALPAGLVCILLFFIFGNDGQISQPSTVNLIGLIPYIAILVLALSGINVFIVLTTGIILAACIAFISTDYSLSNWVNDINSGFASMQDIFILSLLIGGLSEVIKQRGGIAALTTLVNNRIKSVASNNQQKNAYFGIAGLAFFTNFFTANNTVSIIVVGETAKQLSTENALTPATSASILDIFACINQGLIPYSAQALLLGATLAISPVNLILFSFYPITLLLVALIKIFVIKSTIHKSPDTNKEV